MKCFSQINQTVRAFVTHDRDMAKEVIEEDAEVNEYEVKLEKKSLEIIALLPTSFTGFTDDYYCTKSKLRLGRMASCCIYCEQLIFV